MQNSPFCILTFLRTSISSRNVFLKKIEELALPWPAKKIKIILNRDFIENTEKNVAEIPPEM